MWRSLPLAVLLGAVILVSAATTEASTKPTPAQKCFADNIEAWSVNEITINWNAPLAWVAAYLDEKGK